MVRVALLLLSLLSADTRLAGKQIVLLKGKTAVVTADRKDAVWSVEPANVVALKDKGDGKAEITALRDWFDETPNREPQAKLKACAGDACTEFTVTCLIDANGTWSTLLDGKWRGFINHAETRQLVFVQNGRDITFETDPGKPAKLRLEGNTVRFIEGEMLTVFDGTITGPARGGGHFESTPGFSGKWSAVRR